MRIRPFSNYDRDPQPWSGPIDLDTEREALTRRLVTPPPLESGPKDLEMEREAPTRLLVTPPHIGSGPIDL